MTTSRGSQPVHFVDDEGHEYQQVDGSNGWRLVFKIITPILAGMMVQLVVAGIWIGGVNTQLAQINETNDKQSQTLSRHDRRIEDLEIQNAYKRGKRGQPLDRQKTPKSGGDGDS
jgi:hypothetical protein